MSMNKCMIQGRLTRDPELRYTPNGQSVVDIGIATSRRYKTDSGPQEETTFVDVTFWGKGAEAIAKHFSKGKPILVEGRLQMDEWTDKTSGQKRTRLKVIGEQFHFQDGDSKGNSPGGAHQNTVQGQPVSAPVNGPVMDDDGILF